MDYDGHLVPAKWLQCAGQNVSRTTYSALFGALVKSGTVTITIASPAVISWAAHGRELGDKIQFATTGALPTGLVAGTDYYVIAAGLTGGAFQLSATPGGAAINTSGTQSGVHTAIHAPHGVGDGSTTFGVPERRGIVTMGKDNMNGSSAGRMVSNVSAGSIDGTVMGSIGGDDTHTPTAAEMFAHDHPGGTVALTNGGAVGRLVSGNQNNRATSGAAVLDSSTITATLTMASQGSTTPFSVVQPSAVVKKIIFANA